MAMAKCLGRRPADPTKLAHSLKLAPVLKAVPDHPASVDYLAPIPDWQMLGNDTAGDCVAVSWANYRYLVTSTLTTAPSYPSQDMVWQAYRTQNPDFDPNGTADTNGPGSTADQGMVIQDFLDYLVKTGGPDGVKALGFAQVDYSNLDEVKAAQAIFGGLWVGIAVQQANMDEFDNGQPWDFKPGSPLLGGHSVLTGGYLGDPRGDVRFITWATETDFTDPFWAHLVEECWVVIWPEHLGSKEFLAGVDLAQFAADYTAITGRPFPADVPPAPTPTPNPPAPTPDPPTPTPDPPTPTPDPPTPTPDPPAPTPTPDPPAPTPGADDVFAAAAHAWLESKLTELSATGQHGGWLSPADYRLAAELRRWLTQLGEQRTFVRFEMDDSKEGAP